MASCRRRSRKNASSKKASPKDRTSLCYHMLAHDGCGPFLTKRSPRLAPVSSENRSRRTPVADRPPITSIIVASVPSVPLDPYAQAECISLAVGAAPIPSGVCASSSWQDTLRQVKSERLDKSIVKTSSVWPSGDAPPTIIMVSPSSTAACELRGGVFAQGRETHSMHSADPEQIRKSMGGWEQGIFLPTMFRSQTQCNGVG